MKKFTCLLLIVAFLSTSSSSLAEDSLQDWSKDTEALWRTGSGAHDGSSTAIAAAIIGTGVLAAILIAVLAAVLHQSKSGNGHNHCNGH